MDSYCENCGDEERLFEAVTSEGVKSLCRRCLRLGNYPIIEKANSEQMRNQQRLYRNTETISIPDNHHPAKVSKTEVPKPFKREFLSGYSSSKLSKKEETEKVDKELEGMVLNRVSAGNYADLVENFHWVIQQGRRIKKVSPKQLAEQIAEPEILIASAEKGKLPKDYDKLVSKLEQFLGVQIRKKSNKPDSYSKNVFDIKKTDLTSVTTTDLKKFKEERKTDNLVEENGDIEIISFEDEE